jgi:hypothetical protein
MPQLPPFLEYFALGLGALLVVSWIAGRRRKEAREETLRRMGFRAIDPEFFDDVPFTMDILLGEHYRPEYHYLRWAARGDTSVGETVLFEFVWGVNAQDDAGGTNDRNTMIAFRVPRAVPSFLMHRRNFVESHTSKHWRPITFEGRPVFNERYYLTASDDGQLRTELGPEQLAAMGVQRAQRVHPPGGDDPQRERANDDAVRKAFTPAVLDALEAHGDKNLRIEKDQEWLFIYRYRHLVKPAELRTFVDSSSQLAEAFGFRR